MEKMGKIKILNIDQLYARLKNLSMGLDVHGYDAEHQGIDYNGKDTLLEWFFTNIGKIKEGCDGLLVAQAMYSANYCAEADELLLSSTNVNFGILIQITQIWHEYQYGEDIRSFIDEEIYLLKTEDVN